MIVIRRIMATANPISEDNFILELNRVKESIVTKFREISEHLDERKTELLRQINAILVSYQSYKQEYETANEKKKDLEKTKLYLQREYRHFDTRQFDTRHFDTDISIHDISIHDISIHRHFDTPTFRYTTIRYTDIIIYMIGKSEIYVR